MLLDIELHLGLSESSLTEGALTMGDVAPPPNQQAQSTEDVLRTYIMQQYGISPTDAEFTNQVHLFDYGYVDSFGAVDLISFVQQRFGIEVRQSDLLSYPLNTIDEIATFVSLRQKGEL